MTVRVLPERVLEVEDNGPGIPEEERGRVFERFHRLLVNDTEGSGLGLSIVKEIAEIHAAAVEISHGRDHVGACFRIKFQPPGTKR